MLNNACSPGGCFWNEEVGSPYCGGLAGERHEEPDTAAREWCGPVTQPIDAQCGPDMEDGDVACDAGCENILICHEGKMMLNSPCSDGKCVWRDDTQLPYCVSPSRSLPAIGTIGELGGENGSTRNCGFAVDVGAECPAIAREGHRFCSSDCAEVLKCNDGVMEIDEKCGTSCNTDIQKDLGHGAFCLSDDLVSVNPPGPENMDAPGSYCGFTQEAGENCSVLLHEGGRLCEKGCNNLLKCKNRVMIVEKVCGSDGRSCWFDSDKKLGKGAFCNRKRTIEDARDEKSISSPVLDKTVAEDCIKEPEAGVEEKTQA
ncbi:hypothetical protein N0V93_000366 [Gnomoniopsis smithogilvyi]|uniref:Uncharacterized protein n=1 Tax=Gnomoniopsis smithogilvyi TaxID=1191159 RepID=A0A9W8Z1N3_9PEZI|nr:hypothetical protein N0V93_000366 [Gnomoniopsis smithogilvyi]